MRQRSIGYGLLRYVALVGILWLAASAPPLRAQEAQDANADEARKSLAVTYPELTTVEVQFRGTRRLPEARGKATVRRRATASPAASVHRSRSATCAHPARADRRGRSPRAATCAAGAELRYVTRSDGKGATLLVIENVPIVSCPSCGGGALRTRQSSRAKGDRQRATLGWPKGVFRGCAPEVPGLKCRLEFLYLACAVQAVWHGQGGQYQEG